MIDTVVVDVAEGEEADEGTEGEDEGDGEERDELVGTLLDCKYQVLRRLGEGGFGWVYEARDLQLDHPVAIKVLPRDAAEEEEWAALKQEARRITRLQHPNIVEWKTLVER
jgi:serine/threonine protein kinase